ncbi:MAG: NAD(P)H-dependent flavin oxidoreductase [Thiolinea sp.]
MATQQTIDTIFNLRYPIIQAPMAGVQDYHLAATVSHAGGLGSLPCALLTPEKMDQELQLLTQATKQPFNVNFFSHTTPDENSEAEQHWRQLLAPYFAEYGVDIADIPTGPSRMPYSTDAAAVLAKYKPAVVSFHFGLPAAKLVDEVKSWGSKVMSSATTVAEAQWLEANGADLIIAQGLEAGGHRGHFLSHDLTQQSGTMALLPQVQAAVNLPVIAAGGIASAKEVHAASNLGAAGVQIGTTYLLCDEARTSALHRAALKSPGAAHTALTNLFSGRPARGIVNRIIREQGPLRDDLPPFPLAGGTISALKQLAEKQNSHDFSSLWCGQNVTGCQEISAAALTESLGKHLTD